MMDFFVYDSLFILMCIADLRDLRDEIVDVFLGNPGILDFCLAGVREKFVGNNFNEK